MKEAQNLQLVQNKIINSVAEAQNTLLICHKKPDGDALGAICALISFLEDRGKKYRAFCIDAPPSYYNYLPRIEKLSFDSKALFREKFDLIIVLDSGDLRYAGVANIFPILNDGELVIINIDHHPTNENFGHYNLVIPTASSTSEIIVELFKRTNIPISKNMATCLLTGILTDTSSFSNPATTLRAIEAASSLLIHGARLPQIIGHTLKNKSIADLKLWGRVLTRLRLNERWGVATTVISREDLKEYEADDEAMEGLINFLNNLSGARIILLLKEHSDGKIKGSLRTTQSNLDVSKIATLFGGGGHQKAAGFTIEGRLKKEGDDWQII